MAPQDGHWIDATCSRGNSKRACIVVMERVTTYASAERCKGDVCIRDLTQEEGSRDEAFRVEVVQIMQQYVDSLRQQGWTPMAYANGTLEVHVPTLRRLDNGLAQCVELFGTVTSRGTDPETAYGVVWMTDMSDQDYCATGVLPEPVSFS